MGLEWSYVASIKLLNTVLEYFGYGWDDSERILRHFKRYIQDRSNKFRVCLGPKDILKMTNLAETACKFIGYPNDPVWFIHCVKKSFNTGLE